MADQEAAASAEEVGESPQTGELVFPAANESALAPVWVSSQVELAKALATTFGSCDRKSINRFLKIDGNPWKTSDGRYNVTAWKLWCAETGHLNKKVAVMSSTDLDDQNKRLKNEKLELENAVTRGELMHVDDVCKVLCEMVGAFAGGIRGMKDTLATQVVGLSTAEAAKRIRVESDTQLTKLALGEWAKKKAFWSSVYAQLSDLHKKFSLGAGLNAT